MIKKSLIIFLLLSVSLTIAQEKSLLWKISGNGLKKDSYLFGTMHVSEKIAFHLDDVFFESLLKSDFVGLESDPSLWLDYFFDSGGKNNFSKSLSNGYDFYNSPFKLTQPKQQEVMFYLSREDMLLNGILYRTNLMMQNFQEETYLDMFIYQSGKKFGKKIYSLENLEESSYLVQKAQADALKRKSDLWLQKLLKRDSYLNLMKNAYRDRNIFLLDSLNEGMYSENYLENMLYVRNKNIAHNIDSIAKNGSLFSAIGAAHLAGKKGVISILRNKGYTITPLVSKETSKGVSLKAKIEEKRINTKYSLHTSPDGFFTAKLPNKLQELTLLNNTIYLCPDLANGAYVIITRINTFSSIHGRNKIQKDFDRLLKETIPGKIITKKSIKKQGVRGVDIVNQTKTGDFQRYQIFFTPIEILIFKMDGKKDFVKVFGNQFFDSITFNNLGNEYINVAPTFGGFKVNVPKYHTFTNIENTGNRILQAIDNNDNYYFVKEVTLNDVNYIEEDSFELERIQERFYKNIKQKYKRGKYRKNKNHKAFISSIELNKSRGKFLHLKTVTNGGHYYLLGYLSKKDRFPEKFFNSFEITNFSYRKKDFKIQKDTALYFSVNSTVKPVFKNYYTKFQKKKYKKYKAFTRNTSYESKANEQVFVSLHKYHDLKSFKNLDSLWNYVSYIPKRYNYQFNSNFNSFSNKKLYVVNKVKGKDKKGNHFYSYLIKDSLSSKAIKVKNILAKGAVYKLKSLIDTTYKESTFVSRFYKTFKPKDTVLGKNLFKDKISTFLVALKNKDSIVLEGYRYVSFNIKDVKKLIKIISEFNFDDNQLKIKEYLIKQLGKIKSKKSYSFLEDLYKKSFDNPYNQLAILKAVSHKKTKKSYRKILNLLENDIPLTNNKYDIRYLVNSLQDSLELSKHLFPDLLNYTSINEYKKPIYLLLSKLLKKKHVKASNYKQYKRQILNEARIELKRELSKRINNNTNTYSYRYSSYSEDDLLNIYVKLLFPFRKEKNVKSFLIKLNHTDNYHVKSTYISLLLENNEKYDSELFNNLMTNLKGRGVLYQKLHGIGKTSFFPKKYNSKEEIYKSLLFRNSKIQKENDSILFVGKRTVKIINKEYEAFFFKKKSNKVSDYGNNEWKLNYIVFPKKESTIFVKYYYKKVNQIIDETKSIEEVLDTSVERIKYKDRKRVNLSNKSYRNKLF